MPSPPQKRSRRSVAPPPPTSSADAVSSATPPASDEASDRARVSPSIPIGSFTSGSMRIRTPAGHRMQAPALRRDPPKSPLSRILRTVGRSFHAPRRLKFTREGKFFIGITLGVGFAAVNTANNLLYLLLGMLLALIVVSGVMSEISLRDLTVTRRLPARAQVGRPHLVEIEVFNHKSRIPSYAIEVEDLRAGQPADKRCFFLKISPRSAQVAAYRRTPTRRGRDLHTGVRIATRFPFGLFEKSREILADGELIIYPAVDAVRIHQVHSGATSLGDGTVGRGAGEDVVGLRPMRHGEDPRDIYWRKSAATGQLVLRERAREARPDAALHLDAIRPAESSSEWDSVFERRVRDVASRAVAHLKRGDSVLLQSNTGVSVRADRRTGADPILRALALVAPTTEGAPRDLAHHAGTRRVDGGVSPLVNVG